MIPATLAVLGAYLLGSIPFALLIARMWGVPDLRKVGSGNLGATNVWRVAGGKAAIGVFFGDIGKGVAAVLIGRYVAGQWGTGPLGLDIFLALCAVAAVLGHVFPIYLGFRGGKGVATGLGAMAALLPAATAIAVGAFAVVVATTRYVSLASMIAGLVLFATVAVRRYGMGAEIEATYVVLTGLVAALVIWTHRGNLQRLLGGTENRFSLSSRSEEEKSHV